MSLDFIFGFMAVTFCAVVSSHFSNVQLEQDLDAEWFGRNSQLEVIFRIWTEIGGNSKHYLKPS
jgi:hypothetical protein